MSDFNLPPAGPPPPPARRVFMSFKGKDGCFEYTLDKDGATHRSHHVAGFLRRLWLEWDPGNGLEGKSGVPARWELVVEIDSPETEYVKGLVRVDFGPAATVYVLASQLLQVGKDEYVSIGLRPGTDATLTECATWTGSDWSHKYTPKSDGRPVHERYADACAALCSHPAFEKPTPRRSDVQEPPLPGAVAGKSAPAGTLPPPATGYVSSSAEGGANPASAAPGINSDAPKLFGWTLKRVPTEAHWQQAPTAEQPLRLRTLARSWSSHRLALGDDDVRIVRGVAAGMGQASQFASLAAYALACDLLTHGTLEHLEQLVRSMPPIPEPMAPATSEYDPFADE